MSDLQAKFTSMLNSHDWYYTYTEVHEKWLKGFKSMLEIKKFVREHPQFEEQFNSKCDKIIKGE